MGTKVGPDIVTDGLLIDIDAGSQRSFTRYSDPVEVLIVAGGGGGGVGSNGGGGGGAGGVKYIANSGTLLASSYSVTVGAGGAGSTGRGSGANGSNSAFGLTTATGGGRGGGHATGGGSTSPNSGGSGGGGAYATAGAAGVSGQGFAGGSGAANLGLPNPSDSGGGGGGAGAVGANGQGSSGGAGAGGAGVSYDISGKPTIYAGGGAGATNDMNVRALGGSGGGGDGGTPDSKNGDDGLANTGSGGGGGNGGGGNSGAGGSGVVIIRYLGNPKATGGTITQVGSYTIHTFTSSGTFADAELAYNVVDNSGSYALENDLDKVTDKAGTWDYDGVDQYITGPTNSFGTLSAYTIAFWARRDSENKMYISTDNGYFYWYGDNSWRYVTGGGGGEYYYPKSVSIPSGTWGYYVATYDGSNVKIYRQGVYEGAKAATGTVSFDSSTWQFGKHAGSGSYYFNGLGGNICLYNKALTQAEVTQNYNAWKSRYL
jgi:hypothetical protein